MSPEEREKHLVREYLEADTRPGYFVEVGANDPTSEISQTWHLEQRGWRGLLIEPVDYLYERLVESRPASRIRRVACSSPDKRGEAELLIPVQGGHTDDALASLEEGHDHSSYDQYERQKVDVLTLDDVLAEENDPQIDFVSIDVEGTELDVLRGFDLSKHRPRLILIEDRLVFLEKHRYLRKSGYHLARRTGFNNWYVPAGAPRPASTRQERLKLFKKLYLSLLPRKLKECLKMKSLVPLGRL